MKNPVGFSLLLFLFLTLTAKDFSFCNGRESNVMCHESERNALLTFRKGLVDPQNLLSTWDTEKDCCRWEAVGCDNATGYVTKLDLQNPNHDCVTYQECVEMQNSMLSGDINHSLLALEHLSYLDLSWNNFTTIPEFLGSLRSLRFLSLLDSNLHGLIPPQLGNLSNLQNLLLGGNDQLYVKRSLWWLSHLSSLTFLDMSEVNLEEASDWLQVVNMLPSLSRLRLSQCKLRNIPSSLPYVNFTSLFALDLSSNQVEYTMPCWIFNLSSNLILLDLGKNYLQGSIPDEMGSLRSLWSLILEANTDSTVSKFDVLWQLCKLKLLRLYGGSFGKLGIGHVSNISGCIGENLEFLSLSSCKLEGQIPDWFGQLSHMKFLFLDSNSLSGSIPASLGNLSSLLSMYLSYNQLSGVLPDSLGKLSSLIGLYLNNNQLSGVLPESLGNLTSIQNMYLYNNQLSGVLPDSLGNLSSLRNISLSHNQLKGSLPTSFGQLSSTYCINLSYNKLRGDLSNVVLNSSFIDLRSNFFEGQLPHLGSNVVGLFLSNNSFSGSLSPLLCKILGDDHKLMYLDLSHNSLSGEIPGCWTHLKSLKLLNLGSNNLFGEIPLSLGSLRSVQSLRLHNNNLSGSLPSSLQNNRNLTIIDLGANSFSGNIPSWIGHLLTELQILRLRSNNFSGYIPQNICNLSSLQILDIGDNKLTGAIPRCLSEIDALVLKENNGSTLMHFVVSDFQYIEDMVMSLKGHEFDYTTILQFVKSIDLSSNNLSGEIPSELSNLHGLQFLNLSRNSLNGKIPEMMDGLKWLEALDLSKNDLTGHIPQSMSSLTFLSFLNLSYNNLSGKIPEGTQLQSFNELSYTGNPELCGPPLSKTCTGDDRIQPPVKDNGGGEEQEDMLKWFYFGLGPGFIVGFWGFCGVLIFKRRWRYAYFRVLDDISDKVYVAVKLSWLVKKLKRNQV